MMVGLPSLRSGTRLFDLRWISTKKASGLHRVDFSPHLEIERITLRAYILKLEKRTMAEEYQSDDTTTIFNPVNSMTEASCHKVDGIILLQERRRRLEDAGISIVMLR
jgi:predicted transcriptional regulator